MTDRPEKITPADFRALLDRSLERMRLANSMHAHFWRFDEANWRVHQKAGEIVFNAPNNVTATAPVQIIGTYSPLDGTWLWAWDDPFIELPLRENAQRLKEYGEQHGIDALTTRELTCSEEEAWEFTALAYDLCKAQGGYGGSVGTTRAFFMTFGGIRKSRTLARDGEKAN